MRNTSRKETRIGLKQKVLSNIHSNLKEYIIVITIFLIGIIIGTVFINNTSDNQIQDINEYLNNFILEIKNGKDINKIELLKESLIKNGILIIAMWFIGSTVIGIPIILGIVSYRGFCIGYAISASIAVLGTQKGIAFVLGTMIIQNIIFIPTIIVIAASRN